MITSKRVPPFVEVTCEPDGEYQYFKCESSVAGLFFMRGKDGKANICIIENNNVKWSENTYNLSDMNPTHTCHISVVTEKTTTLLPTKEVFDARENN